MHSTNSWIVDTGATTSISPHVAPTSETSGEFVTMANGSTVPVVGYGQTNIGFKVSSVLCVPSAHRSLLSIGKACEDDDIDEATFNVRRCWLYKNGAVVASGARINGLYELIRYEANAASFSPDIWH